MRLVICPDEPPLWLKVLIFASVVGLGVCIGYAYTKHTVYTVSGESQGKYEEPIEIDTRTEEEKELQRLYSYCERQREPEVCKGIAKAGVRVEWGDNSRSGCRGLARFAVILGRNEQNYRCPDFNCFGLGATDRYHWIKFSSYEDSLTKRNEEGEPLGLGAVLWDAGYREITSDDFDEIAIWYKGIPPFEPWVAGLKQFWEEIEEVR